MEKATIYDYAKMCKFYDDCQECPVFYKQTETGLSCEEFIRNFPSKANEIILNWCKEHPVKTRQDKFLEMFPNVELVDGGVINICPNTIDCQYGADCSKLTCKECRKDYWLAEVDE